jgi:DNA-binding PadR family transcriptional regulator
MSHSRQIVNDLTALQEDVLTLLQHHVYSGMEVIAALDACSGRHYNVANTYTLRKHMVRAGLLTTQRRPGRQRPYFTTTPLGTERLTACRQRCRALALWGCINREAHASGCINFRARADTQRQ